MSNLRFDILNPANAVYLEEMWERYRADPSSVDGSWALLFAGLESAAHNGAAIAAPRHTLGVDTAARPHNERAIGVFDLIHSYRQFGHLIANLDPLGNNQPFHPLLDPSEFGFGADDMDRVLECPTFKGPSTAKLSDLIALLRATYCGTIGVEYMDIFDTAQRTWLQEQMEPGLNRPQLHNDERRHILQRLTAAEGFEQFLHTKFVGQKRFSLEGGEALIPLLDTVIEHAADLGTEEIVLGMAHRGRLNVLAHVLRKPYEMIFSEFEGAQLPTGVQGDGDVKYHLGYSRNITTRSGKVVHLSLCNNPSHLEAVNPVVEGMVRAKQHYLGDEARRRVIPVLIHGDASFTGQGLVSETLSLSELDGYHTGGTIHVIINNQIGFTTSPQDARFTRYPSDVAKEIQAPVFHVNGDDPEAVVQAARLAIHFRQTFGVDVIIDLVCYRRHGHNETDDPTFTQPVLYKRIAAHPTTRAVYAKRLLDEGVMTAGEIEQVAQEIRSVFDDALDYARDFMPRQQVFALGGVWKGLSWAGEDWTADTRVPHATLQRIVDGVRSLPQGFAPHPRVAKLLDERARMIAPNGKIDWACAEMLAFGSLLLEGSAIRLSGQDSGRGTFSHRHSVLRDVNSDARFVPLDHLDPAQGRFFVIDSMLSEAAVLGFEYGFSIADPRNLVLWEAQFGDFANGAQVIIDQFIASGESKWQRMCGLVMLLPHGYEGQGPEHSSARLERYLQLCAENNMQVCNLTTPAQFFHALRRQLHRKFRKPLIIMSPKSLLRHKLCVSTASDLTEGAFQTVLDDEEAIDRNAVRRLLFCSGKVYYDLLVARRDLNLRDVAIVRIEQLYPFPEREVALVAASYPQANEAYWVQEEPANMGAWGEMERRLRRSLPSERFAQVQYAGRRAAASPAVGSYKVHQRETADILNSALGRPHGR